MASSIARHTSTVSLVSTASVPREGSALAQALNRYRDQIEAACDKILEKCCMDNKPSAPGDRESAASQAPRVLEDRAREILTQYLIELLSSLVLPEPLPQSIRDVNARLAEGQLCFPDKLMPTKAELEEFHVLAEKGKKVLFASLDLPVDKIFAALKELAGRFNYPTCIYITAVTEKVISNFLKMVVYFEERARSEHVISAVTIQNIFQFYRDRVKSQRKQLDIMLTNNFPQDYNKCVNELVLFLSSSLEQMNLILRVFREPILHSPVCASLHVGSEEAAVREVFRDALDLYNNFRLLLDYLESDCADDLPFTSSPFSNPLPSASQQRETDDSSCRTTTATTENRRLVGRLLIEPAEEIALASYSDSPDPLNNIWRLSERTDVLESLARSSRAIVHTVSRLKTTSTDVTDSRLTCLHSLCCPSCRMWDQKEYSSSTTKDVSPPSYNCNALINCFRYLLPRLLFLPIFQFFHFYRLVHALHQQAYDSEDRKLLMLVVDYLLSARLNIKSVLSRYPDLHVQLARLVTTGHLVTVQTSTASSFCSHQVISPTGINSHHRSCSASPATSMTPPIRRNSSTQHQHQYYRCNTPPLPPQSQPLPPPHQTPMLALSAVFCAGGGYTASPFVVGTPTTTVSGSGTTTVVSEEEVEENVDSMMSTLMSGVCGVVTKAKLEELERLTGGKDRLLSASVASSTMGKFVMEGRLWVRDEGKRVASERQAYLFTNCLLLCKRMERRTTLAPSMVAVAGTQPLLRVKRRLPLEAAHVIDCVAPVRPRPEAFSGSHPHNSLAECASLLSRCPVSDSNQHLHATVEDVEQCSFSLEFFGTDQRQLCTTSDGVGGGDGSSAASALSNGGLEVLQGVHLHYLHLETSCLEEKADWMASLLSITTSRVFERYLRTLPKLEIPLRLPSPEKYRFAQPDTPEVIVFESAAGQSSGTATITHRLLQPSLSSRIRSSSTTASVDDPFDSLDELDDEVEVVDVEFFPTTPTDEDSLGGADEDLALPLPASTSSRIHSPHLSSQILTSSGIPSLPSYHPTHYRPQIQYATLEKLIERLTYPAYFDAEAVNAFLISYRRFITPEELLDILLERFNVPYPDFTAEERQTESVVEHMKRRFRSGYKRWVQARVVAFLFKWASSPRYFAYDFAPNADLRARLATFLAGVRVRILLPVVQAIEHVLTRGDSITVPVTPITTSMGVAVAITEPKGHHPARLRATETVDNQHLSQPPPLFSDSLPRIDLLQIHPLELAEQVTLHEFELYRRIEFWEVDGRERSSQDSPNLSACKNFSNKFRDWLVYSILSERNFEDRVVAIQRIIDLMLIFEHHRNLQGRQESKAVLLSASVFRLKKAFEAASRVRPYRKWVQQLQREGRGPARRVTKASRGLEGGEGPTSVEKASTAPTTTTSPCLPYIAMRVSTQLIHLELHQPDRVTPTGAPFDDTSTDAGTGGLINFVKQRRLAAIVERFLQHQLVPYTFPFKPRIQQALVASLEAFTPEERDFEARMYALSESYEPREPLSEPPQPAPEVERRLSKEAIQAANYLGGLSLKEKLQHEQVATYKAYFSPRQIKSSGRVSSPRLSSPPNPSVPVPPPPPSPPLLASAPAPPPLAPAEQRVVVLWNTRLRQHRAGRQARLTPAHGVATPLPRPLSSPTTASSTGVIHHHSISDGQMESLSNGRLPTCTVPPLTSPLSSPPLPPPPPPPPRRQSSSGPSTSSPASASHSPSPLFPLTTVLASTLAGEGAAAGVDGGLPPLPPKPGQRTSSVAVGLSPSASSSNPSRQFFDTLHPENLASTPPLPPRRHIS
ncbi:Son of sevenless -like protein 1 [Echinococcus granulosus]|uniref:Protein son of sevenless n=1 Tax=Echinococcus granulosus TaxID=6210 RepID=A0A068W987_ECHGR|nr:Son of sevenless -like protein 1 [Echinococcus granulosus]CDS16203.1 Protein son of sevenless [Echinococcus granulosus]